MPAVALCHIFDEIFLGLCCDGFQGRSGCWSQRDVDTVGDCRGILSSPQGMFGFRCRGF